MIDLRIKGLPEAIKVDGSPFLIDTDFRTWLKFGEMIKDTHTTLNDVSFVFKAEMPNTVCWKELLEFYQNKNITPKTQDGTGENILDYVQDGEYIFASFLQVYGIDLTECDLHWHKFKALLISLPDDCKISEIMAARAYKKDSRKTEKKLEERKAAWSLPRKEKEIDPELLKQINDEFYNT